MVASVRGRCGSEVPQRSEANPTNSTVTLNLGQTYLRVTGSGGGGLNASSLDAAGNYVGGSLTQTAVTTVTLQPGSAAILLKPVPHALDVGGGFEGPSLGVGSSAYQYDPTTPAWIFRGGSGLAGNASAFTAGNPAAPDGTQVAFLQGNGGFGRLFDLTAGTYSLSFLAAQRGNYQASSQTFEVLIDNTVVGTFTPGGTGYTAYTTDSFTVTAGSQRSSSSASTPTAATTPRSSTRCCCSSEGRGRRPGPAR